jgi:hypothetical protein
MQTLLLPCEAGTTVSVGAEVTERSVISHDLRAMFKVTRK